MGNRKEFPHSMKNGKVRRKQKERGTISWKTDPCLALKRVDDIVVTILSTFILSTVDNINGFTDVYKKVKASSV